jgi:DNA modification methylase
MLSLELLELSDIGYDTGLIGFGEDELASLEFLDAQDPDEKQKKPSNNVLAEKFGVPPFTVLNGREGWWQTRKRAWLDLGIKSEVGRDIAPTNVPANLPKDHYLAGRGNNEGGSIFDPVLCELIYSWFAPAKATIIDPFAGGSVRGIVASSLARTYIGVELRGEQVEANRVQAKDICKTTLPVWHTNDSRNIDTICGDVEADLIFSCPPYADLEVYSHNPADLSNMPYDQFKHTYQEIISKTCSLLKQDRFACFVVGEVRDKKGNYRNFVADTIEAFQQAGLHYYNEAIFITPAGTLPIRVGKQFTAGRKLGKTHQNVLIFVKGDGKRAAQACGEVYIPELENVEAPNGSS